MQQALESAWPYSLQLFHPLPGDDLLLGRGLFPDPNEVGREWQASVIPFLEEAGLSVPSLGEPVVLTREEHSNHLEPLIEDMQSVYQANADSEW